MEEIRISTHNIRIKTSPQIEDDFRTKIFVIFLLYEHHKLQHIGCEKTTT